MTLALTGFALFTAGLFLILLNVKMLYGALLAMMLGFALHATGSTSLNRNEQPVKENISPADSIEVIMR